RLMSARLAGEQLPEPRSDVEKEAARRLAEDLEN
ncbi:IS5/IS1182 family transposase, partial [Pseudonocardia nantongensis]